MGRGGISEELKKKTQDEREDFKCSHAEGFFPNKSDQASATNLAKEHRI